LKTELAAGEVGAHGSGHVVSVGVALLDVGSIGVADIITDGIAERSL